MGIPKFFRWAGDRYPAILSKPLGTEEQCPFVDNLYLDMNGIIHNCSHGNDGVLYTATDAKSVLERVCSEVNRLVSDVVKPQRLLYVAVDGVAPRAKLNQQRTRRFRAAKELQKKIEEEGQPDGEYFDSNCITPGTEFMEVMATGIAAYIREAYVTLPAWSHLEVIFSGSDVPGEGEHKLISFIRDEKAAGRMPPNTRHCIYGADADMMMLGVATHEKFVIVLREVVTFSKPNRGEGRGAPKPTVLSEVPMAGHAAEKPLMLIRVHALREYLCRELLEEVGVDSYDHERILDDYVFLSFFVGNDFLPHLPGIHIGDNAFDLLFDAYKNALHSRPGYLLDANGGLDYDRLETIVALVGETEAVIYSEQETARYAKESRQVHKAHGQSVDRAGGRGHNRRPSGERVEEESESAATTHVPHGVQPRGSAAAQDFRRLYYQAKFGFDISTDEGKLALRRVVRQYLQGLMWCLRYYTQGCVSWSYFYPSHYGLFMQDMVGLAELGADITFSLDAPLTPFEQLLACLPPASAKLLPQSYHPVMTSPTSPVLEFYPLDFDTDLNGMKMEYEAVVLLPFIDLPRLLAAEAQFCPVSQLTHAEVQRNNIGAIHTFKPTPDGQTLTEATLPPVLQPGVRFTPALAEGTMESQLGYPTLDELLTHHSFGKTRYSQAQLRSVLSGSTKKKPHNSVFHQDRSESFPMPGVPPLPNLHLGSNTFAHPLAPPQHPHALPNETQEVRLVLDEVSDQFLSGLAAMIQQKVPAFIASDDTSDHACSLRLDVGKLEEHFAQTRPTAAQLGVLTEKISSIFAPIHGNFLPQAMSVGGGLVAIGVQDHSHLAQINQFLLQRLLGDKAFTRHADGSLSPHTHLSAFDHCVLLGRYSGPDLPAFIAWLTGQLEGFAPHLPVFSCGRVLYTDRGVVVMDKELTGTAKAHGGIN